MHAALQQLLGRGYQFKEGAYYRPDSKRQPKPQPISTKKKKATQPKLPSPLASRFEAMWKAMGGPELTPEFRFSDTRKWRLDYFHAASMTAIELEGGIFCRGRHSRPKGMQGDCDKYNFAASIGIFVFRLTTGQVTQDRVQQILRTITTRAQPTTAPP